MTRRFSLALSLSLLAALTACGGGGSSDKPIPTPDGGGGGGGGGGGTTFPYTSYDVYALYGTGLNYGQVAKVSSISATKGVFPTGSFDFRGALGGGETTVTLGTDSVSLYSAIVPTADLSWLAPGGDGQLVQACSVVRLDVKGQPTTNYPKSMLVMVANTAKALSNLSAIPAGTRLYAAEDCKFTSGGGAGSGDIAKVTPTANDNAVVNADGALTLNPVGAASFSVSATLTQAALATGGTGLAAVGDVPVPSLDTSVGSYALHAYSIPRTNGTPRYVVVVQATPKGGNASLGSKGVVSMLVSP